MKRFMNKKVAAIGVAAGLVLGLSGAAVAYFTSTGTGSGSGSVGTATNWGVSTATTGGPLYPGDATSDQTVAVTITNNATQGYEAIDSFTVSVGTTNTDGSEGTWTATNSAAVAASASTNEETSCSSADFALGTNTAAGAYTYTPASPVDLAAGDSTTVDVNLAMIDTGVAQDACQGESPALYVSVN